MAYLVPYSGRYHVNAALIVVSSKFVASVGIVDWVFSAL